MVDQSHAQRADAQFKKIQRAEDGKKAMAEYEAERAAIAAKTERLRALRLARDAELEAAALVAPVVAPKLKKRVAAGTDKPVTKPARKTRAKKTA